MIERVFRTLFTWGGLKAYIVTTLGSPMITRIFWGVFGVAAGVMVILSVYVGSQGHRGWGPEGPVGGWLLWIPPVVLAVLGALVLITNSDSVKLFGIFLLGLPLLQMGAGLVYEALKK